MNSLLRYLLESAACLSFFYIIHRLLLHNETHFRLSRLYLLSSLLLSLSIPMLKIPSPLRTIRLPAASRSLDVTAASPAAASSVQGLLLLIYAAGLSLFLVRFLVHIVRLSRIIHRCGVEHRFGQKIVFVDSDCTPFSFFSYIFVCKRQLNGNALRHILAHERIHIRQNHSLDILAIELVTIVQWFNPFVWPYKKSLKETHEYLADEGVIAQGFNAVRYQLLLFEQNVGATLFEFANNFKQSQIKRRITMMKRIKSGAIAKLKILLLVPLTAALLLAFAPPRIVLAVPDETPAAVQPGGASTPIQTSEDESNKKTPPPDVLKEDWKIIEEKEATIRQKLEKTTDPQARAEMEETLKKLTQKKEWIAKQLQEKQIQSKFAEEEMLKLAEIEKKIEAKIESTQDPEEKTQLQKKLDDTRKKQELLAKGEPVKIILSKQPTPAELKAVLQKLSELEIKVKDKLQSTTDPEMKAQLEKKLADIQAKKQEIKSLIDAQESGK